MPEVFGKWPRAHPTRAFVVAALIVGVTATVGCAVGPFRDDENAAPRPRASTTTAVPTVYQQPADPCAAVPAPLAKRFEMSDATRQSTRQYETDPDTPQDPLVAYDSLSCEWTVKNPGKGPRGRPNQMTVRIEYMVIKPERANAPTVARSVYMRAYEGLRKATEVTVVRERKPAVTADDAYYVYATRRSVTGKSSEVEAAIRRANAVVTVEFSGADLAVDPSLPRGLQLVTRPVAESRLQPVVESLLPEAIRILR